MRFSIVLAVAVVAIALILCARATFGEHSVIVFGLLGIWGVLAFFKHAMNT